LRQPQRRRREWQSVQLSSKLQLLSHYAARCVMSQRGGVMARLWRRIGINIYGFRSRDGQKRGDNVAKASSRFECELKSANQEIILRKKKCRGRIFRRRNKPFCENNGARSEKITRSS
jgi:hypothetical protein